MPLVRDDGCSTHRFILRDLFARSLAAPAPLVSVEGFGAVLGDALRVGDVLIGQL
jgi:hypothetical protein